MNATKAADGGANASTGRLVAEPLYSVKNVADLWNCSPNHVYALIAAGELKTVDAGLTAAKTRIPESALAEFVERRAGESNRPRRGRPPGRRAATRSVDDAA